MHMPSLSKLVAAAVFIAATGGRATADLRYELSADPEGTRFIMVAGTFEAGDRLAGFERMVASGRPAAVIFHSEGGFPPKAMELGRLIRRLGLSTFQPYGLECASACALAFLGGVDRYADPGAIGVHQTYFDTRTPGDVDAAVSAIQFLTADTLDYLAEMDVDAGFLALSMRYDSNDLRMLSGREMARYRVTTGEHATDELAGLTPARPAGSSDPGQEGGSGKVPVRQASASVAPDPGRIDRSVPEARSGRVRHPKGHAALMKRPSARPSAEADIDNGAPVEILGMEGRWYRVRVGEREGYMHSSSVFVDQYDSGEYEEGLHVQLRSFDNYQDATTFVRSSSIPPAAYLLDNGRYAVTLRDTLEQKHARLLSNHLRKLGTIPADSFVTFGNTYVRKVCCG